jgi:hypothetical protein
VSLCVFHAASNSKKRAVLTSSKVSLVRIKNQKQKMKKQLHFLEAMLADMPINKFLLLSGGNLQKIWMVFLKAVNQN